MPIERYQVGAEILRSGRHVLSAAIRLGDGAHVLVKTSLGHSTRERTDLRREFELLRRLHFPGVPLALDLIETPEADWLVTEDRGLRPLGSRLAGAPLEPGVFLTCALDLCGIVSELHRRGIVHGALSPWTVFAGPEFGLQIQDFSIAQELPIDGTATGAALIALNAAAYMAPEQTGRIRRTIDHRADLYSLGATCYELLTGRPPFGAGDPLELVHAHIARTPVPPAAVTPAVPEALSRIVMRLLAKGAEERYQSAHGLRHDLEICRRDWNAHGAITPFAPGERDVSDRLLVSQRLYGREAELAELTRAFEDAMQGRPGLLLVSGYSGVGKTAFIDELCSPIIRRRGFFVAGKFDQVARNVPYGALTQAFRSLVWQVLAEREERLAQWRAELTDALGANGGVVAAVIPEIEFIIGRQPPPVPLDAVESLNRFRFVFQSFVATFATAEHPLVLFLDDLQWADAATLDLIQSLIGGAGQRPLLVIGAYRDNEVGPDHPLARTVERLEHGPARLRELTLGPLNQASLSALLAETLRAETREVVELARVIREKTDGNPFFVIQFLHTLWQDGLLWFDYERGRWTFRLDAIAASETTANVVALMTDRIQRLSPAGQTVLRLGACIGNPFAWRTFLTASRMDLAEAASGLAESLSVGLIRPVTAPYEGDTHTPGGAAYAFLHDRVQQAAYALIPAAQRPAVHLDVGRQLLEEYGPEVPDDRLFEVVNHLNLGGGLVGDERERLRHADLNLAAGRKAKASAAYRAALDYLQAGIALCPETCWQTHYPLMFGLRFEEAECRFLAGDFEDAERAHTVLRARAGSRTDEALVRELEVTLYENRGRYADAVASARAGLARFDVALPADDAAIETALGHELEAIERLIDGRPIRALVNLPVMTNPDVRTAMRLLTLMWAPVYLSGHQRLTSLISATIVRLSLSHGNTEDSAYGYVTHGITVGPIRRDFASAYEWGQLAIAVNERFGDTKRRAKIHQQLHAHVKLWRQPFEACIVHAREATRSGLAAGDFAYAGYGAATESWPAFMTSRDLAGFVREQSPALALLAKINMSGFADAVRVMVGWAMALQGRTAGPTSLSHDQFDEAAFVSRYAGTAPLFMTIYQCARLHLCLVFEDARAGVEAAAAARRATVPGTMWPVLAEYWGALAAAQAAAPATDDQRAAVRHQLSQTEGLLGELAESCPENFRCPWLLIRAEMSRLDGHASDAGQLYEQAAAYAALTGNIQQEALASDLCARMLIARGETGAAAPVLQRAYRAYRVWGAAARLRHLEKRYGNLLSSADVRPDASPPAPGGDGTDDRLSALDVGSVLKVAQAIAGELELDGLLRRLMTIAIENAGAERGVFVEARENALIPIVDGASGGAGIHVRRDLAWEDMGGLAQGVMRYVRRTGQDVVTGRVSDDERFAALAASAQEAAGSRLCVPVTHQGRLIGILYLENSLSGAFTPARIEIVRVLAAQTAISLENARLYESMRSEAARRTEAERALREALTELERLKNRLEAENVYLQEEIRTQHNFDEIVGGSAELLQALRKVERVAPTDATVLIAGETGCGKELFARAVHSRSARSARPLVKVNCGAIPPGLVESELFGHVKGAFTGAVDRRVGRFELANGGTLFLDEIGELPLEAQVKLLRVLQEQEFEPVGGSRTVRVDVRVIAATNRNLEEAVREGTFRADLLYRLNVFPIAVPPLRDRRTDIPLLAAFFLARVTRRIGKRLDGVSARSMERLMDYSWPGNVRELQNVIERAAILAEGPVLEVAPVDVGRAVSTATSDEPVRARGSTLDNVQREHIRIVLRSTGGVIDGARGAAAILGIHPNTLRSRMKKLGISARAT